MVLAVAMLCYDQIKAYLAVSNELGVGEGTPPTEDFKRYNERLATFVLFPHEPTS